MRQINDVIFASYDATLYGFSRCGPRGIEDETWSDKQVNIEIACFALKGIYFKGKGISSLKKGASICRSKMIANVLLLRLTAEANGY